MSATPSVRVLVVDDDPQIRQLICIVLNRGEMECVSASGGEAAIEKLDHGEYAAVILDLTMPHVNGFEVIRHMQETHSELLRRLIVLTAMSDTATQKLDKSLVFAVLSKPFDVDALAETVSRCVAAAQV